MKVTVQVEVSDQMFGELPSSGAELTNIFSLGLDRWQSGAYPPYPWLAEILEKLAELPLPEEVLAWKLSPAAQARIDALLAKNRDAGLTPAEEREWQCFEQIEHFARLAKARAHTKLRSAA